MTHTRTTAARLAALTAALGISAFGVSALGDVATARADVGPAASLLVVPENYSGVWNNAAPLYVAVEALDSSGNFLGYVTDQSSLAVSPDGSCAQDSCTTDTGGPHTVTATYGALTGTLTLDAQGPSPIVATSLPDGQVGVAYSHSVLAWSDASTVAQLDSVSALPAGLRLSSTGILSGVPTVAGTYRFDVIALNANGSTNTATTITIAPGTLPATPTVSVGSASVREGNFGRTRLRVPIRLSTAAGTPVTVSWHTVKGTAAAGKDYVYAHGTVTIPAGQTTATVPVSVIGDKVRERNETFAVVLSSPRNATLGTARGTVTITNDD